MTSLLGLCTSCTPAAPSYPPPTQAASPPTYAQGLGAFYQALDALQSGRSAAPVQILQIGDSHTANDGFSGRMRELFQARFGDAGRGIMPPGIPFRYYRPSQVTATATGWQTIGSLNAGNPGPFGLAGVRQHATGPADMTLQETEPGGLGDVWVEALGQPGGGTLDAARDGAGTLSFSTNVARSGPLWLKMPAGTPDSSVTLRARGNGPTDVLAWSAIRPQPGVTYSNLGTIGATVEEIGRFDHAIMQSELRRLHPALILIAFGTNEAYSHKTDMATYPTLYAQWVQSVHETAPWASIVIIAPPDGNRDAAHARPGDTACPPPESGPAEHTRWTVPALLAQIRDVERRFAAEHGYFYWDWSQAMGGMCSMQALARTVPPMGAPDHVHLFKPGYRATAEKLYAAIISGYDQMHGAAPLH